MFLAHQSWILQTKELKGLIDDLNPYTTAIFTDISTKTNLFHTYFLNNLLNYLPSILIYLNKMNQTNVIRLFKRSIFQKSRRSVIYIILSSDESKISNILEDIDEISFVSSRPKSLLLLPEICYYESVKKSLVKAWSLKFLDFSVVKTNPDGNHEFITYNPFSNDYIIKNLKDTDELFPDKLKNLHGYHLKTRAFDESPFLSIEVKNNKVVKVSGFFFSPIESIAKKLNFKLQIIEDPHNSTETVKKIVKNLETNEINISPIGLLLVKNFQNRNITVGNPSKLSMLVVVAPIIKTPRIDLTSNMFIVILMFMIIFIIFFILVHFLKFYSNYWNCFYIFGILIGVPTVQPRRDFNKIVYLTIAILSVIFSNSYFSMLADVKLQVIDQEINSYDDIVRLNMTIYVPGVYNVYNDIEEDKKGFFQEISKNFRCYELLIKTNNACCIYTFTTAEYYLKTLLDTRQQRIMKLTGITFQHKLEGYFYEKASPFAEKIEHSLQQLFESNIISVMKSKAENKVRFVSLKQSQLAEEILLNRVVLSFTCIGFFWAFIVFAYEYAHFYNTHF